MVRRAPANFPDQTQSILTRIESSQVLVPTHENQPPGTLLGFNRNNLAVAFVFDFHQSFDVIFRVIDISIIPIGLTPNEHSVLGDPHGLCCTNCAKCDYISRAFCIVHTALHKNFFARYQFQISSPFPIPGKPTRGTGVGSNWQCTNIEQESNKKNSLCHRIYFSINQAPWRTTRTIACHGGQCLLQP